MRPIDGQTFQRLNMASAALLEADSTNPLLPAHPGLAVVGQRVQQFESWAAAELARGFIPARQVIVSSRKAGFGIRPFAVWGVLERVLYRALVEEILSNTEPPDRSAVAYREFVIGPLRHWATGPGALAQSSGYVVKTDVVAFYQYVDHRILADELLYLTGERELITLLMELLQETQQRDFGLPQALWPSHRLAEVYIATLDRQMARRGARVWRYSDDIRLACDNYADALRRIEELDSGLRDLGLVMNEHKTSTPTLDTYLHEVAAVLGSDELPDQLAEEPPSHTERGDEYEESTTVMPLAGALSVVKRARPPSKTRRRSTLAIDITRLSNDDFKKLRAGWSSLIAHRDPSALDLVHRYFTYAPGLTAHVSRYLVAISVDDPDGTFAAIDNLLTRTALTDWQQGWIVDAMRQIAEAGEGLPSPVMKRWVGWLRDLGTSGKSTPWLQAQAIVAQSVILPGTQDFDTLERLVRISNGALVDWYVEAARRLATGDDVLEQRFAALVVTTPPVRWLSDT